MPNVIVKVGSHRGILKNLVARARGIVRVASAYVTDKDLLLATNAKEARLLIALSTMDVVIGATKLDCLRVLVEGGVKCRVLTAPPRLHAKVYIFDNDSAVVSSANLTAGAFDKNIEVGVPLRGRAVGKLAAWFDQHWGSDAAEPLTLTMISNLNEQTVALRKKFQKLRRLVPPESSTVSSRAEGRIQVSSPASYFLCNTDRRYDREAEKMMKESDFAAAWETFDFIEHIKRVKRGDLIFMYANRVGIIAIGKAEDGYEKLLPAQSGRVKQGGTPEWRIPVKWLSWDAEHACPWRPPSRQTFVDVSSDDYAARRKRALKHFRVVLTGTA